MSESQLEELSKEITERINPIAFAHNLNDADIVELLAYMFMGVVKDGPVSHDIALPIAERMIKQIKANHGHIPRRTISDT